MENLRRKIWQDMYVKSMFARFERYERKDYNSKIIFLTL